MSTIVTRTGKGFPLSNIEMDTNLTNLNSDKYESGDNISAGTLDATGLSSLDGGIDVNSSAFTVDVAGNASLVDITSSGAHTASIAATVSATGTMQSDAQAITKTFNVIASATPGQGVKLPTAQAGLLFTVLNSTNSSVKLWPNNSGTINSGTIDASINIPAGTTVKLVGTSSTNWNTMVESIIYDSAGNRLN